MLVSIGEGITQDGGLHNNRKVFSDRRLERGGKVRMDSTICGEKKDGGNSWISK